MINVIGAVDGWPLFSIQFHQPQVRPQEALKIAHDFVMSNKMNQLGEVKIRAEQTTAVTINEENVTMARIHVRQNPIAPSESRYIQPEKPATGQNIDVQA